MLSRWSIRKKLWLSSAMLFLGVAMLTFSSFRGVYAYRWLARSISYQRATELRLAMDLSYCVGELRSIVSQVRRRSDFATIGPNRQDLREEFRAELLKVNETLRGYEETLRVYDPEPLRGEPVVSQLPERQTVAKIRQSLDQVAKLNQDDDWVFNELQVDDLDAALADLHWLTLSLPQHLHQRLHELAGEVRGEYRTWIVLTWISSLTAAVVLVILANFFRRSVFKPLGTLVQGCRRIARDGDFEHRIQLHTHDEVAELAGAMNAMTERFLKIRDDLDLQIQERDEQVRQRTKQVVRSEQLAAVGFLAAGVAHEINNPLAAIAWAAEALEMRLHDIMQQDEQQPDGEHNEEIEVLRKYLRKIQDEAFRCKGITEKLLDYSRMGDVQKHPTDLSELVQGVIEMVRHLGKYREKNIEFARSHARHRLGQRPGNQAGRAESHHQRPRQSRSRRHGGRAAAGYRRRCRAGRAGQRLRNERRGAAALVRAFLHPSPRRPRDRPGAVHYLSHRPGSRRRNPAAQRRSGTRFRIQSHFTSGGP